MIRDPAVLEEDFVPNDLEHRDAELTHLESVLQPLADGIAGPTVVITGPTGAGKTVTTRYVTRQLVDAVPDIRTVHLNCWRSHTEFRVFYGILERLGLAADIHRGSTPYDELISRLEGYDGPPVVVILDEADQLDSMDIFYDLHSLPQFAQLIIANDHTELLGHVNDRLESRLQSSEHVVMNRYGTEELVSILDARVRWGLSSEVVADGVLTRIADAAAGDARLAIGMLRRAANHALREEHEAITPDVLEDALPAARSHVRQRHVDALNDHQRTVLEIVRDEGPVSPQVIYDRYESRMSNPNQLRTVRSYLSKLTEYGLVESKGSTRDRTYSAVVSEGS